MQARRWHTAERLDDFVTALDRLDLDGDRYLFGHLAEGNFHVNIVGAVDPQRTVDQVLEVVVALGELIASEHGIGVDKAKWWRQTTDPALLAQSRRVKEALDPDNILNPRVFWRQLALRKWIGERRSGRLIRVG